MTYRDREAALEIGPVVAGAPADPGDIVARAVERKGGRAALASVRTVRTVATLDDDTGVEIRVFVRYPDAYRVERVRDDEILSTTVWDGRSGRVRAGGRVYDLPAPARDDIVAANRTGSIPLLLAASAEGAALAVLGEADVAGERAHALQIELSGVGAVDFFVAARTGDHVATRHASSRGTTTVIESDFRVVGPLRVAHRLHLVMGATVVGGVIRGVELNPPLSADLFRL